MRTPEEVAHFIEDSARTSYMYGEGIDTTQMSRFERIMDNFGREAILKDVSMKMLGELLCMNNYMQDVIDTTPALPLTRKEAKFFDPRITGA